MTALPDWLIWAFQPWVTCWLPAKDQPTFQLVTGLPVLVTVTDAVKPASHWVCTVYCTEQPAVAAEAEVVFIAATTPPEATTRAPAASKAVLRRTV
ncbi:hypothetical protein GA0115240_111515 [Streptomyces sp. DvalAA-14]|nr:hypothetical protein GA0115240_111515 [Streptomyces sp. DvalAA-14]